MSLQNINIGTAPNDDTGDLLRDAFDKVNDNFTYLESRKSGGLYGNWELLSLSSGTTTSTGGVTTNSATAASVTAISIHKQSAEASFNNAIEDASAIMLTDGSGNTIIYQVSAASDQTTYVNYTVSTDGGSLTTLVLNDDYKISFAAGADVISGGTGLEKTTSGANIFWKLIGETFTSLKNGFTHVKHLFVQGRIWIEGTGGSVFIGEDAGTNDDLSNNYNVFIGANAGYTNTIGAYNVAIGESALYDNLSGSKNTAIGEGALFNNTSLGNTAVGYWAGKGNTSGGENVSVGYEALANVTTGNSNTAIGTTAGKFIDGGTANTTATGGIYIGNACQAKADGQVNEIVIGKSAKGNGTHTATIGDDNLTDLFINENGDGNLNAGSIKLNVVSSLPTGLGTTDKKLYLYFDSTDFKLALWDGSAWKTITFS